MLHLLVDSAKQSMVRRNMKFSCLDIIVSRNITNFVHCGCGDNGFAALFTFSYLIFLLLHSCFPMELK